MVAIIRLIVGVLLLTLGRNLFWLFVAAIGFLAGASFATRVFQNGSELLVIGVALAVGLVGALLALVLPNVIGAIAGFVAGGYLAMTLLEVLDLNPGDLTWVAFVVGGIAGAVIVLLLFDWALIGLSSLAGAVTIASIFAPRGPLSVIVIAVLFVVGVLIQTGLFRGRQVRTT